MRFMRDSSATETRSAAQSLSDVRTGLRREAPVINLGAVFAREAPLRADE
jgi:hypothetical protein